MKNENMNKYVSILKYLFLVRIRHISLSIKGSGETLWHILLL